MPGDRPPLAAGDDLGECLRQARAGSSAALGRLLEACRPYLLLVAHEELFDGLRGKAGASDLVQETFLKAQDGFGGFRGGEQAELLAWLRQILVHTAANLKRHYYGTEKRAVGREVPLGGWSGKGPFAVPAPGPSPSGAAAAGEQDAALHDALELLPEEYRRVVAWRSYDRLPFEEIGRRLGRSAEAARKLWVRAVERLNAGLDTGHDR